MNNDLYQFHCLYDIISGENKYYSEFEQEMPCSNCSNNFHYLYQNASEKKNYCAECFGSTFCEVIATLDDTRILIEKETSNVIFSEKQDEESVDRRENSESSELECKLDDLVI